MLDFYVLNGIKRGTPPAKEAECHIHYIIVESVFTILHTLQEEAVVLHQPTSLPRIFLYLRHIPACLGALR